MKEDIKNLQELTKEANKIMSEKVNNNNNKQEDLFDSPQNFFKVIYHVIASRNH